MTRLEPRIAGVRPPTLSAASAPYWEGTRQGVLRFQRCQDCGRANFGPGLRCAGCQGAALAWEDAAGTGRVLTWTVVWRPPVPAFTAPYAPAIVRLDEGVDVLSALVDLEVDQIRAGLAVRVVFVPLDDTITLPFFAPAGGPAPG